MFERFPAIQLGNPGEDISIRDLRAVSERFKKLHQIKRESIRHVLNVNQRQFLDVLPLILHSNHPALPGFVSPTTPAGIFAYQPDKRALDAARHINQSFNPQLQKRVDNRYAIEGLFLMGSVGTIAFTKASDIDIWLCHREDLTRQEADELQKKTKALEDWAASLHLEVHFYPINSKQFLLAQKTPVSADSSGETQHYLLLEEFYRTSVYMAGKILAWWLVPPEHENDYQDYLAHLLERRFIKENQILDLGGLDRVPADEFISATQWHIFKALYSPYKSLFKLSLLECYASEYPKVRWLCVDIKRAVYRGEAADPDIDPYVLVYRKLEDYLVKSHSYERLATIRQIFCRKLAEAAGDLRQIGTVSPYERYLRELAENWQGPKNRDALPQNGTAWDIEKILAENAAIVEQLAGCHYRITCFAHDHIAPGFQESNDMRLLGRKLKAFFERKTGKIEIITTPVNGSPQKPKLSIVENRPSEEGTGWALYFHNKHQAAPAIVHEPLYQRPTLIEMLCWLTVNGFYRHGASVRCDAGSLNLATGELNAILERLDAFFKSHFDFSDALGNYERDNTLTHSLIFINLGRTPSYAESGPYVISNRDNPFGYGMRRESLVQTVDRVSVSRWNEVLSSRGKGIEGLFDCLVDIVNESERPVANGCLTVVCQMPGYANNIVRHIEHLFQALLDLRSADSANPCPRYALAGGGRYFVFSRQDARLQYQAVDNEAQLIKTLASPRKFYGSVKFSADVLAHTPVPAIYRENRPHAVQCFVHQEADGAKVYILDEKGSLYIRPHPDAALEQIVNQYARFLHSLISRKAAPAETIQFFEIKKSAEDLWLCVPLFTRLPTGQEQTDLRITDAETDTTTTITIYWNGTEFSSHRYGDRLFAIVRERILEFRRSGQNYPAYITDLELPATLNGAANAAGRQTLHFLECKEKIEARLNGKYE